MFILKWLDASEKKYNELKANAEAARAHRKEAGNTKSSKDEGLFKQVHNCLQKLRENPKHNGLNTHKFDSLRNPFDSKQPVFEAYAQNRTPGAYRVFWCYGPNKNEITIIAITPHP